MKKGLVFFGVLFSILIFTALPSFAGEVNFDLANYPMHSDSSSDYRSFQSCIVKNVDGNYYYVECWFNNPSTGWGLDWKFNDKLKSGFLSVAKSNNFFLYPCILNEKSRSNSTLSMNFSIFVYDAGGTQKYGYTELPRANFNVSTQPKLWCVDNITGDGSDFNYLLMSNVNDFYPLVFSASTSDLNDYVVTENPDLYRNSNGSLIGSVDLTSDFRSPSQPSLGYGESNLPDTVKINGTVVYAPGGGSGSATVITGSGSGSVTPVYDGSGNVISYDIQQNYDLSIPEPNGDADLVELPSNPSVPQADTSSFSALEWFVNFFDSVCRHNNKIFALIIMSLTIGLSTLILNKRR